MLKLLRFIILRLFHVGRDLAVEIETLYWSLNGNASSTDFEARPRGDQLSLASADVTLTSVTIGRLQPPSQPWPSKSRIDRILFQTGNGPRPSGHLQ